MMDQASQLIAQINYLPGRVYASPAYQVTPDFGPYGIPYWMQGFPMQTCVTDFASGGAPEPYQASVIYQPAANYHTAGQYAFGQAPTQGIFTGVE